MDVLLDVFRSAIVLETELPADVVGLNTRFEDIGVDAYSTLSILEFVEQSTGIEFPTSLFRDCGSLADIQKRLGRGVTSGYLASHQPSVQDAHRATSSHVGQFATEAGVADFWSTTYPDQRRLVLAYITEAFTHLGCPLHNIPPNAPVPTPRGTLPKHTRLMSALFDILAEGGLVTRSTNTTHPLRTAKLTDPAPSPILYERLLHSFPLHANTHRLLHITGSQLAACLTGAADPIKLLFGNPTSRELMQEFYTNAPMSVAASKHLTALFHRVFAHAVAGTTATTKTPGKRIEILEIGAGFGGTTKFILEMLVSARVPFKYTFTDISPSFFSAARKRYAALGIPAECVEYDVLNIENTPPEKFRGRFDAVLSTNCIHATKDLAVSCANARMLLRPGGFFGLVEFTTRLYWLDLVFGLLDGWWLFEDGRGHCIATEEVWEESLRQAGFADVVWAETMVDGKMPNPQVIAGCTE